MFAVYKVTLGHRHKLQNSLHSIQIAVDWCLFLQICLHAWYILGWPEISGSSITAAEIFLKEKITWAFFTCWGTLPKCHWCMRDEASKWQHSNWKMTALFIHYLLKCLWQFNHLINMFMHGRSGYNFTRAHIELIILNN